MRAEPSLGSVLSLPRDELANGHGSKNDGGGHALKELRRDPRTESSGQQGAIQERTQQHGPHQNRPRLGSPRHHLAEQHRSDSEQDDTEAHLHICEALLLHEQCAAHPRQRVADDQGQHQHQPGGDAYRPGHPGIDAGCAQRQAELRPEEPSDEDIDGQHDGARQQDGGERVARVEPGQGGEPGEHSKSDITEQIKIINRSNTGLDFHFFQYVDLDLSETADDDLVFILGGLNNTVFQREPLPDLAANETVVTPSPSHYEVAEWGTTLAKLENGVADDLGDMAGPVGYADVTWAFQWDFAIPPGGSVQISKDKRLELLPEPLTMLSVFGGVAGIATYMRKRKRT